MSTQKPRYENRERDALVKHGRFRNQETNDEFNFPCPFFAGQQHLEAKDAINNFIHRKFHTYDNGVEDLTARFLKSTGIKNGVLRCVCSRCKKYRVQLYYFNSEDDRVQSGWYLTDLHPQRHSECGCSVTFVPRATAAMNVNAAPAVTQNICLKRSAESSELLTPEPAKVSRTLINPAGSCSSAFDVANYDLDAFDMDIFDLPDIETDGDDNCFQFLLCSRNKTPANLVHCEQLPNWLALEVYEHLHTSPTVATSDLAEPPADVTVARAYLSTCRSDVLLQSIVATLAQAIHRHQEHHRAALNFQATALHARYHYLLNAFEFQNNIVGVFKLVAREADALDALQAQITHTRVLSVLSALYNTEVHPDCAQSYFQLALSWERSGNFEMKTKFLSQALFIFLQLCLRNSSNSSTSSSASSSTSSNSFSLKLSMLEPMYYLACLRFRTWCRDDFIKQKKMLEWCRDSVAIALEESHHDLTSWRKLCLLQAKILQSLAITHGELVEADRQNFVRKGDILSQAVNLRLQLYDNNEHHIEVVRTQMHVIINQYELDGNVDNKRKGLKRVYAQMERHYNTTEQTEMAWVLRSIAEATPNKSERRGILEQVLKTQYALLTDKAAFNFSIQRTKLLIDATYADDSVAGGTSTGASASPPASATVNVITPSAQGAAVIVQLEDLMSRLCSMFQHSASVSQPQGWVEQTNTLLSNIMNNCS